MGEPSNVPQLVPDHPLAVLGPLRLRGVRSLISI